MLDPNLQSASFVLWVTTAQKEVWQPSALLERTRRTPDPQRAKAAPRGITARKEPSLPLQTRVQQAATAHLEQGVPLNTRVQQVPTAKRNTSKP